MKTADSRIGRRDLGGGHYVEVKRESCGALTYSAMRVEHDWDESALNRCDCGKPLAGWTAKAGHFCSAHGMACSGECR